MFSFHSDNSIWLYSTLWYTHEVHWKIAQFNKNVCVYFVGWEPEGRYHYWTMLHWGPEWRNCCTLSVESQKGVITIEHCSVEDQNGAIAVLCQLRARRVLSLLNDVTLRTRMAQWLYFVSWEPEGRYHYWTLFCWGPEGRYWCTKSMVIASFWFSMEHSKWLMPFWFSADNIFQRQ